MKTIPLTQGKVAIVDDEDYSKISAYKWYVSGKNGNAYAATRINGGNVQMHRFILNPKSGVFVDHINRNPFDNRKENLRACTHQQNMFNQAPPKNKTSKYKGVHWHKRDNRWVSSIRFNDKLFHLGNFKDEIDAALYYDVAAQLFYGEFAYLNNV